MLVQHGPGSGVVKPFKGNEVKHAPCPTTKRGKKRQEAKLQANTYKGCGRDAA